MQLIKFLCVSMFAALALFVSGCASEDIVTALPKDPQERSLAKVAAAAPLHQLTPGDRVKVTVFDLTAQIAETTIDEAGSLSLPPLKPIDVKGMTPSEAADRIAKGFAEAGLFRNAPVTIDVLAYGRFYVLGEVTKPGEYDYRPGMSLFAAVATAGGHTYRANKGRVYIRRAHDAIETEYDCNSDLVILPGDVIRIPEWRL